MASQSEVPQKKWPPMKKCFPQRHFLPQKNSLMLGQSSHRLITLVACLHPCFLLPVLSEPAWPDMLQCSLVSSSLVSDFSESHATTIIWGSAGDVLGGYRSRKSTVVFFFSVCWSVVVVYKPLEHLLSCLCLWCCLCQLSVCWGVFCCCCMEAFGAPAAEIEFYSPPQVQSNSTLG